MSVEIIHVPTDRKVVKVKKYTPSRGSFILKVKLDDGSSITARTSDFKLIII